MDTKILTENIKKNTLNLNIEIKTNLPTLNKTDIKVNSNSGDLLSDWINNGFSSKTWTNEWENIKEKSVKGWEKFTSKEFWEDLVNVSDDEVLKNFSYNPNKYFKLSTGEQFAENFKNVWSDFGKNFMSTFGNGQFWGNKGKELGTQLLNDWFSNTYTTHKVTQLTGKQSNTTEETTKEPDVINPPTAETKTNFNINAGGSTSKTTDETPQSIYKGVGAPQISIPDLMKNTYSAYFILEGETKYGMSKDKKNGVKATHSNIYDVFRQTTVYPKHQTFQSSDNSKMYQNKWAESRFNEKVMNKSATYINAAGYRDDSDTNLSSEGKKNTWLNGYDKDSNNRAFEGMYYNTFRFDHSHPSNNVFGVRLQGIKIPEKTQSTFTLPIANGAKVIKVGSDITMDHTFEITLDMDENLFLLDGMNLLSQNYHTLYKKYVYKKDGTELNDYVLQFFPYIYNACLGDKRLRLSMIVDVNTDPRYSMVDARQKNNEYDTIKNPWTPVSIIRFTFQDCICLGQSGSLEFTQDNANKISVSFKFTFKKIFQENVKWKY